MKPLVEAGKLYLACPPLYKITIKKGSKSEVHYAWDDIELKKYTQSSNNFMLQRYKGLGEMNFDQLWETTMDPKTRSLIQVKIDDESEAEKRVSILMGDQVAPRRTWIENNVDFVDEDDYQINKEAMYE
jgi:topoisomerase-4 subunit B